MKKVWKRVSKEVEKTIEALKITAKNMLEKNADPRFVSGVTGLSMA